MSSEPQSPPTLPGLGTVARVFNLLVHVASLERLTATSLADALRLSLDTTERLFSGEGPRAHLQKLQVILDASPMSLELRARWERWASDVGNVIGEKTELEDAFLAGDDVEPSPERLCDLVGRCGSLALSWARLSHPSFASEVATLS